MGGGPPGGSSGQSVGEAGAYASGGAPMPLPQVQSPDSPRHCPPRPDPRAALLFASRAPTPPTLLSGGVSHPPLPRASQGPSGCSPPSAAMGTVAKVSPSNLAPGLGRPGSRDCSSCPGPAPMQGPS
ncbi:unnamed protein product [Natator depressus]